MGTDHCHYDMLPNVYVFLFVSGDVVCKDIGILHVPSEERLNCMI